MNLLNAFCETSRPRLQDVRRLDLEDPVASNGGRTRPTRPIHNRRLLHALAAPRRENDLRIPSYDLGRIDDAIFCQACGRELREDRRPARELDQLLDPLNA